MQRRRIGALLVRHDLVQDILEGGLAVLEVRSRAHDDRDLGEQRALVVGVVVLCPRFQRRGRGARAREPELLDGLDGKVLHRVVLVQHAQHKTRSNIGSARVAARYGVERLQQFDDAFSNTETRVLIWWD